MQVDFKGHMGTTDSTLLASITVTGDRFLCLLIRNLKRLLYRLVTTVQTTELVIDNCQTQIDGSKCTHRVVSLLVI